MEKMVEQMDIRMEKNHKTSTTQTASCVELRYNTKSL